MPKKSGSACAAAIRKMQAPTIIIIDLLQNLLIICKWLIYRYIEKTKTAKGTNWEQKFQKPQNENICLTNLNVENKGNFPILSSGECKLKNIFHSKFYQIS
jgi:hypothetical protein